MEFQCNYCCCRICELQDSNQFTLFDEYEIGLLLGDMSEVFATAGL